MEILLLVFTILTAAFALYRIYTSLVNESPRSATFRKRIALCTWIAAGANAAAALADISEAVPLPNIDGLFTCSGLAFAAALSAVNLTENKFPQKRKYIGFPLFSAALLLIAELFVFNFNAFHLIGQDCPVRELNLADAEISGGTFNGRVLRSDGSAPLNVEFSGLDLHIGTITVEAGSDKNKEVFYSVGYNESTYTNALRKTGGLSILSDNEKSRTAVMQTAGNSTRITFTFNKPAEGETITVSRLAINQPYGFHSSIVRFLLFYILIIFFKFLLSAELMSLPCGKAPRAVTSLCAVLTAVLVVAALYMTVICKSPDTTLKEDFTLKKGNQITQEIVDAFAAGQAELLTDPSPELQALSNPYDASLRKEYGAYYLWDHVYYQGKYYSYYGIAPVLLIFLPYYKITGFYFPSVWAVFLFVAAGICFLSAFYIKFIKKFFPEISVGIMLAGLLIIQLSSGAWFNLAVTNFYKIAQSSGFLCITAGAYFMLGANLVGEGKISKWRLSLSASLLALAVLCRPTLAVYCVVSLIFILFGFFKNKKDCSAPLCTLKYLCAALLPFFIIGGIQMYYNYIRFDSVLDFGIQYSLTINDFTNAQYSTHAASIGFYNFLLAPPSFNAHFPFFTSSVSDLGINGFYFIATYSAIGLIFRAFPILGYFFTGRALKLLPKEKRLKSAALLLPLCVLAPLIIIFSIWESGYGVRYQTDFSWQLLLGAFSVIFTLYKNRSDEMKKVYARIFTASLAVSLVLNFAQVYNYLPAFVRSECRPFDRLFEFWI